MPSKYPTIIRLLSYKPPTINILRNLPIFLLISPTNPFDVSKHSSKAFSRAITLLNLPTQPNFLPQPRLPLRHPHAQRLDPQRLQHLYDLCGTHSADIAFVFGEMPDRSVSPEVVQRGEGFVDCGSGGGEGGV